VLARPRRFRGCLCGEAHGVTLRSTTGMSWAPPRTLLRGLASVGAVRDGICTGGCLPTQPSKGTGGTRHPTAMASTVLNRGLLGGQEGTSPHH
jgi:hypothetical protein